MNAGITQKILDRIEDGFQTADQVLVCGECARPIFALTVEEVKAVMDQLVAEGKAEWRDQGRAPGAQGQATQICVPKETGWKT